MINRYLPHVHAAAARDAELSANFIRVASLVDPPEALLRPGFMFRVFVPRRRAIG